MTIMQLLIVVNYSTLCYGFLVVSDKHYTSINHNAIKRSYETWYWYKVYGY